MDKHGDHHPISCEIEADLEPGQLENKERASASKCIRKVALSGYPSNLVVYNDVLGKIGHKGYIMVYPIFKRTQDPPSCSTFKDHANKWGILSRSSGIYSSCESRADGHGVAEDVD